MPSVDTLADNIQELLCQVSVTFMSNGGLYHVMFLSLVLRGFSFLFFGLNLSFHAYSLLSRAAWYVGVALLNTSLSDEIFDNLWFNSLRCV